MISELRHSPVLQSPLFRGIGEAQVTSLLAQLPRQSFAAGEIVFWQGERGDSMFVVESGMVEVYLTKDGRRDVVLSRLGPGDAFGEMALLSEEPRSATVQAVIPTIVRVIPREPFLRLAAQHSVLLFNLSRILVARLSRASKTAARVQESNVVAIVGRVPPVVGSLVATNLAAALAATARRSVLLVDTAPGRASSLPGRERMPGLTELWSNREASLAVPALRFGPARFKAASLPDHGSLARAILPLTLSEALAWMRRSAEYVVLNLTSEDLDNVLLTVPQVDRTYVLVTPAQLGAVGDDLLQPIFEKVRLDRATAYPVVLSSEETSEFDARRRALGHLGVPTRALLPGPVQLLRDAAREPAPMAILAPHLSFSRAISWLARDAAHLKVGVALGSGGARGFAHVGVFRCFEELGIPNDYLAGTSMGSIIGAPRALGMNVQQGSEAMSRLHKKFTNLLRFTLSGMALFSGASIFSAKGVEDTLRELVGDATFEELPVPFAAVAADLQAAKPVVLKTGLVADALRASSAIPALWPPKVIGDHILVDGAVVNPIPTQVVRDLGADIVIAVDLSAHQEDGHASTGPRLTEVPNMLQTVARTFALVMADRAPRDCLLADFVIRPRLETIGVLQFDKAGECAELGYQAAMSAADRLRSLLPWLGADGGR